MNRETENWLASAEYDLETARDMFGAGRYVYVVFMCHLAVEKVLKALVGEATGAMAPRTHDLMRLVNLANVTLDPVLQRFVEQLTDASVGTRYPEDIGHALSDYDEAVAKQCLEDSSRVIAWLRADPRLSKSSSDT